MGAALTGALLAANAALLLSWALLVAFDTALARAGLAQAWTLRRRMVALAWAAGLLVPLGLVFLPAGAVNATDWLVAEFLRGNSLFAPLSATEFERLLAAREAVPRNMAAAEGPVWQAAAAALLAAALFRLIRVAMSALQVRHILSRSHPVRRVGRVRIAVSADCSVPFATAGLRGFHVVVPAAIWADPAKRRLVVAHEIQHLRQGDPALELGMALLSPAFALNPAFWALARRTRRLREHGCDAACVARSDIDPRSYALCLLDVARAAQSRPPGTLTVALLGRRQDSATTPRSQLGQRIEQIAAGGERRAKPWLTVAVAAAFLGTATAATLLLRAPEGWSHERLMLSSVVNLERLETINTLSQPPLR